MSAGSHCLKMGPGQFKAVFGVWGREKNRKEREMLRKEVREISKLSLSCLVYKKIGEKKSIQFRLKLNYNHVIMHSMGAMAQCS